MLLHMIMDQTAPAPPSRVLEVHQILECIWQRHHIDYEAECEFAWLLANLSKFKFQMWSSGSVPCLCKMLFCLDLDASIQQAQGGDIQFAFNTILVFRLPWGLGLGHLNLQLRVHCQASPS